MSWGLEDWSTEKVINMVKLNSRVGILRKMEVNYIGSFFSIFLLGTHRGALLLNIAQHIWLSYTVRCLH